MKLIAAALLFVVCMLPRHLFAQDYSEQQARELLCGGKWSAISLQRDGKTLQPAAVGEPVWLQFKADGSVVSVTNGNASDRGDWKLVKNKLILSLTNDTRIYRFTLRNENSKVYLYATFDVGDGPVTEVMVRS